MNLTAKDVMVKEFNTIQSNAPVEDAIRLIFENNIEAETGSRIVSILVTDEFNCLEGIFSMFDILYHLRPPVLHYIDENINSWNKEELDLYINRFKGMTVNQVMSSPAHYISPEVDLMVIIDRMVKKRWRRLPVVENAKVIGVVYLSNVCYHVCKDLL
ncbi:MAG: hypothetical protein B6I26_02475 [Desulfobacteraceae bacterium 4572_130]|nr:MAG: hypothetical protein B6I26_02475 [Desulfobacteraceae bacterium 4572_130]